MTAMSIIDMVIASPYPSPHIDKQCICFTEKGKKVREGKWVEKCVLFCLLLFE